MPLPAAVAEHDDGLSAGAVVVGGREGAAEAGRTPTTWKKLPVTSVTDIMRPSTRASISGEFA